jgi:hypothetical protein
MQRRRHFKQTQSLAERLLEQAGRCRADAKSLPPGPNRDKMISKACEAETASRMSEWLRCPGLQRAK